MVDVVLHPHGNSRRKLKTLNVDRLVEFPRQCRDDGRVEAHGLLDDGVKIRRAAQYLHVMRIRQRHYFLSEALLHVLVVRKGNGLEQIH